MQSTGHGREPARRRGASHRAAHGRSRRAPELTALEGSGRPRRSGILSSVSFILAGVLVVVGVGFIAGRAMRAHDAEPSPAALGGLTAPSPSAEAVSMAPSPPASRPTTPTATRQLANRPPDRGSISVDAGSVPAVVDLSAEGTRDWVHWGEKGTFSLERYDEGAFDILEGTPDAPRFRHALSPQQFRWTGGSQVERSDGTTTGIRTCGQGNAFTMSAAAGTGTRVLRLYLGVVSARGRLGARLTTGAVSAAKELEQRDASFRSIVYTLTYRAPKNARISVTWTTEKTFGKGCGGVALEAATIR